MRCKYVASRCVAHASPLRFRAHPCALLSLSQALPPAQPELVSCEFGGHVSVRHARAPGQRERRAKPNGDLPMGLARHNITPFAIIYIDHTRTQ